MSLSHVELEFLEAHKMHLLNIGDPVSDKSLCLEKKIVQLWENVWRTIGQLAFSREWPESQWLANWWKFNLIGLKELRKTWESDFLPNALIWRKNHYKNLHSYWSNLLMPEEMLCLTDKIISKTCLNSSLFLSYSQSILHKRLWREKKERWCAY